MDRMPEGSSPLVLPTRDQAQLLPIDHAAMKALGIFGFDSIDPRSRSFNLIRARLTSLHRERGWRLFGIVSATSQVGKSYIAANVAAALSRSPRYETTLVDLDLRRGSASSKCGIDPELSMLDFLGGSEEARTPPAYAFEGQRLLILPTRAGLVASAELLAGQRAQSLFRAMRTSAENRLFVVDLPPVFANDDASTVLQRLDAYIVVAEEGKTTKREVRDATELLGADRLAGVILNKYRGGLMSEGYGVEDYYNRGYGAPVEE
ncbi:MAG: CpsD/CapB family tyrosine-protein kinase [Sphingomicrobium sp.]|nr:CpsD/CapB family tyrosine-protein kinase [Sphingomonadales bacterium]